MNGDVSALCHTSNMVKERQVIARYGKITHSADLSRVRFVSPPYEGGQQTIV